MNLTEALDNAEQAGIAHPLIQAAREWADLLARVDAGAEIWAEHPCPHGQTEKHTANWGGELGPCYPRRERLMG